MNDRPMMQFASLASGSSGNASFLETDGFGVLIDFGVGPRMLSNRLAQIQRSRAAVHAVVLSHTHSDHWHERTLAWMLEQKTPLYCHSQHQQYLASVSEAFVALSDANLIMAYEAEETFRLTPGLTCLPFEVLHDGGFTCGFRFEGAADFYGESAALAYASDLGSWNARVAGAMSDVDVLAVEFNHDPNMQHNSRRSRRLVMRNLGERGHLSNEQAASLVAETRRQSSSQRLQHVVQLHLSRECNRPELAVSALRDVIGDDVEIHTATQNRAGPLLRFARAVNNRRNGKARPASPNPEAIRDRPQFVQPTLPGLD